MNPEARLIATILETADFKSFLESGLHPEDLLDPECQTQMQFLVDYYMDPKHPRAVPTKEVFLAHRPDVVLPEVDRTNVKELVEICKIRCAKKQCQLLGEDLILRAETDPASAFSHAASSAIKQIGKLSDNRVISLGDYAPEIIEEYERSKEGLFSGVPWPWDRLNETTKGIENGIFVLIYGRTKMMKTWLALYTATEYYRKFPEARVLIYSLEMPVKQMAQRVAAIMSRVPYTEMQLGKLRPEDEVRFMEILKEIKTEEEVSETNGRRKGLFIVAPKSDTSNVLDVRNKIEFYDPDLVIVDGVYYLAGTLEAKRLDWKEIAKVSRDLKISASEYNVPIIGVSQANRSDDEDSMKDVGFTDNLARDPDIVMWIGKQETANLGTVLIVAFKGIREFNFPGMLVHGKPATNFNFIKEFDNLEQIKEFISKSKQAVAGMAPREDPGRILGRENFIRAQMLFGDKG